MWLFTSGYIWKKYPKIVFWWFQTDNHEEILWISGGSMVVYWYTLLTSPDASCMTKPGCLRQKESMIPFFLGIAWSSTVYSESTVYTTSPPAMCSHHGYLQHPQPSCSRLSWRRSLEPCQSCPVVEKKPLSASLHITNRHMVLFFGKSNYTWGKMAIAWLLPLRVLVVLTGHLGHKRPESYIADRL